MTAVATEAKTMTLRHPENSVLTEAVIVRDWFENGRFTGYELQFPGERRSRHLRFTEIRKLQEEDV